MKYLWLLFIISVNVMYCSDESDFYEAVSKGDKEQILAKAKLCDGVLGKELAFNRIAGSAASDCLDWQYAITKLELVLSAGKADIFSLERLLMAYDGIGDVNGVNRISDELRKCRSSMIKNGEKDPIIYKVRKRVIGDFAVEISRAFTYYDSTKLIYGVRCSSNNGLVRHFIVWTYEDVNRLNKVAGVSDKEIFTLEEKYFKDGKVVQRNLLFTHIQEPDLQWVEDRVRSALTDNVEVIRVWKP